MRIVLAFGIVNHMEFLSMSVPVTQWVSTRRSGLNIAGWLSKKIFITHSAEIVLPVRMGCLITKPRNRWRARENLNKAISFARLINRERFCSGRSIFREGMNKTRRLGENGSQSNAFHLNLAA